MTRPNIPFIGRRPELAAMVHALTAQRALVLVEGEPGIGKTRLLAECTAALAGQSVLTLACPPLPEPFPLGPVVNALHDRPPPAGLLRRLSPLGGALRPLFPEWGAELPEPPEPLPDAAATRHRLIRALAELIGRLDVAVLAVEDAHWADPATLELLALLEAADDPQLNVVVTYRPNEIPADSALTRLTAYSAGRRTVTRIAPEPLNRADTGALATAIGHTHVPADVLALVHQRTGGVPLALVETLSLLADRGELVGAGRLTRRAVTELRVPPTVRDSVQERVARLDRPAQRMLAAAAVLAEPATEPVLAAVAGLTSPKVRAGLVSALRSGLLTEVGPGRFAPRHVLAAQAIEEGLPAPDRRALHATAGAVLPELAGAPPARLSRHFRAAGDLAGWRVHAEAAADLALASGDDRAAIALLLELLTAATDPPEADREVRLARKLGSVAAGGGAALGELGSQVVTALRRVLAGRSLPVPARGEVRLLLGRLLRQLGEFEEACQQTEAAVTDLADRPELAAPAMLSLAYPRGSPWPAHRHLSWLARAADLLPQVGGPEQVQLAVDRASALLLLGEEAGWPAAAGIDPPAPTLPERRQLARLQMNLGHVAILWGRYNSARTALAAAVEQMRATGYQRLVNSARLTDAYLDWCVGAWSGLAEKVGTLAAAEDTLPEARLEASVILGLLELAGGLPMAAERRLREALAEAGQRGLSDAQLAPAAALARWQLVADHRAAALALTRPGIETVAGRGIWVWATDLAPVHVAALIRAGAVEEAAELVAGLAAGLAGRDAPAPAAALLSCRAAVAAATDSEAGAVGFEEAAQAWSALPRPYDALLAAEQRGLCLLAAGDREQALAVLDTAQRRLTALPARWDADRVARLLRRHGVEVARTWRGGRRGYGAELSPREKEVAGLVARGLTNRQVAEALFVSPRTVDHHLSGAMHKLGVTSRTALARHFPAS